MNDTPETRALLVKGKLEQICPAACRNGWRRKTQTAEAASRRCSATSPGARQGARASQAPRLSNRTRPLPATTAAAGRHPG